jgi:(p)ppGpp synthase/HD superfamily hydrolase
MFITKESQMKEWITVLKAADAAARWHVQQKRKGAAQEPYINHLLEVASLVADAADGKDPNLVVAALLHDDHTVAPNGLARALPLFPFINPIWSH